MALLELVRLANRTQFTSFLTEICYSRTHLLRPTLSLPCGPKLQYPPRNTVRSFHPTQIQLKKTNKANRAQARDSSPPLESPSRSTDPEKAYDFSSLESKILKSIEHLTHELSQLRAGGRFNPELLESLKVRPTKSSNETVRLGDIAQVVPKGRVISIIANEEDVSRACRAIS
jgi:ribosome recycling factor